MEGESRLRRLEAFLQIADALFAALELVDDAQASLVRQRVKELGGSRAVDSSRCGHETNISIFFVAIFSRTRP